MTWRSRSRDVSRTTTIVSKGEIIHATTRLHGRDAHVQLRDGAQQPDRAANQPSVDEQHAGRDDHGLGADREHRPIWDVHEPREPHRRRRDRGRDGRAYADAVYSGHPGPVGDGFADGPGWWDARIEQHLPADVYLGRSH